MSTVDSLEVTPGAPEQHGPGAALLALWRRLWRWLTSMRTALLLLFLLAVAAIPGSLLPQRNLNADKVRDYHLAHPKLAPVLDRIGAFDVFASPWFSAIYLLLFVSLVGCLLPRARGHLVALVRVPPDAPSRLDRLPAHADGLARQGDPAAVAQRLKTALRRRRFRTVVRRQADGGFTVSAEKGYLKETGNLLFHFALLALLVGVAFGSWYGYHANRVLVQGEDEGFCNTLQQFDDYGLGARVRPGDLEPFCLTLNRFQATFLDSGEPADFRAEASVSVGDAAAKPVVIKVNEPLRLDQAPGSDGQGADRLRRLLRADRRPARRPLGVSGRAQPGPGGHAVPGRPGPGRRRPALGLHAQPAPDRQRPAQAGDLGAGQTQAGPVRDARRRYDRGVPRHPTVDRGVGTLRPGRAGRAGRRVVPAARPAHLADRQAPPGLVPGTAVRTGQRRRAGPQRVLRLPGGIRQPAEGT